MDEFNFIRDILSPLAGPEGLNLEDDAARFTPREGYDLVITKDAMVEGVHFPNGHYGNDVAEKLLRVNLSDLAAKGARPLGYFLSLAIPNNMEETHFKAFAAGLQHVQESYGFTLWGGDTVSSPNSFIVSATFIGQLPKGHMVRRSGAANGDDIWVTGTIGDAYLGLQTILGHKLTPNPSSNHFLQWEDAYFRPEPRLLFRKMLREHATASLDVSDGLLADAAHIAQASQVSLEINIQDVPLSDGTRNWLKGQANQHKAFESLVSGGDDYEILFTASSRSRGALLQKASKIGLRLTHIGSVIAGKGVICRSGGGQVVVFKKTGYKHLL